MIKNIKAMISICLMSISICLSSYAQEPNFIKNKGSVYVIQNGRNLITEGKYEQAIHIFSAIIKANPRNAAAYYWRGISYYLSADEWHTLKRFHEAIPLTSKELATICYAIDTQQAPHKIDSDPQFQSLKKLVIAYRHFLSDTEHAFRLEPKHYKRIFTQFMRGHPISLVMAKAFFGD